MIRPIALRISPCHDYCTAIGHLWRAHSLIANDYLPFFLLIYFTRALSNHYQHTSNFTIFHIIYHFFKSLPCRRSSCTTSFVKPLLKKNSRTRLKTLQVSLPQELGKHVNIFAKCVASVNLCNFFLSVCKIYGHLRPFASW